jgi:hypothetical protein
MLAPRPSPGTSSTTTSYASPGPRSPVIWADRPGDPGAEETTLVLLFHRVDKAGSVTLRHNSRLRHIGIGRTHKGTHVILLTQDLDVRVVNAITGELLRQLTIDPDKDYQPRHSKDPNPHP